MKQKILIISYKFPPNQGIGGRRWAKFAKLFLKQGYDVKVITLLPPKNSKSNWDKDTKALYAENRVLFIENKHSRLFGKKINKFSEKLLYRFVLLNQKITTKGNYWDPSKKWLKTLIPVVHEQIDKGYNTIIATGGPFGFLEGIVNLKKKYPKISVNIDFRDPWTNNKTIGYSYDLMSDKRKKQEVEIEKKVIQGADRIISVYDELNSFFKKYTINDKFYLITNGFDKEDFYEIKNKEKTSKKIIFVFVGTLYSKAIHVFNDFIKALDYLKINDLSTYNMIEFNFYGKILENFNIIIENHKTIIKHHGFVSLFEANTAIANSDATLLFLTDDMSYSFSTKYYEYISQKKPIFLFSKKGNAGKFISENKLGFFIEYQKTKMLLSNKIKELIDGFLINQDFDISKYEIEYLSKEYLSLIDKKQT